METWGFPLEPYPSQVAFATELQRVFDEGRVGVFESPTGTGKSLSIICGALTWLVGRRLADARKANQLVSQTSPWDWVDAFDPAALSHASTDVSVRARRTREPRPGRRKPTDGLVAMGQEVSKHSDSGYDHFLLADSPEPDGYDGLSGRKRRKRFDSLDSEPDSDCEPQTTTKPSQPQAQVLAVPRIYFCSRTHTQLSQFINEVKRTRFAGTEKPVPSYFQPNTDGTAGLMVVAFGSRKLMCINSKVNSLASSSAVNDRCAELIDKENSSKKGGCPYYKRENIQDLADVTVHKILDIEELVAEGKMTDTCPYFAAREALRNGPDLAVLPYAAVLHEPTRESLGVVLDKNSTIIFDEAHNLVDAVNDIHSATVYDRTLSASSSALDQYISRYERRLSPLNLYFVNQPIQLKVVLKSLKRSLECKTDQALSVGAFSYEAQIDNINLFKLVSFIKSSHLSRKLMGFLRTLSPEGADGAQSNRSDMHNVESLLVALTNPVGDGRVIITAGRCLKFVMLNPAAHFDTIVQSSQAVLLAGGTMAPRSSVVDRLLRECPPERILDFSCGHVVPQENVLGLALGQGPMGVDFCFTHEEKSKSRAIDQLGRAVVNISKVAPKGTVLFFPSYAYEDMVFDRWKETNILGRLSGLKQICREQKGVGAEAILEEYRAAVKTRESGALLSAVIGGKLSEGINFADELGRCVIIVGMPYPNSSNPETREMMAYVERTSGKRVADQFLEDSCMKAVNQSVGRVIRHARDHAAIVFLDRRYTHAGVMSKLPGWMLPSCSVSPTFGKTIAALAAFFKRMETAR